MPDSFLHILLGGGHSLPSLLRKLMRHWGEGDILLSFLMSFPHSFTRGLLSCLQQRVPRDVLGTFLFPYCIYYGVFCETIFRS